MRSVVLDLVLDTAAMRSDRFGVLAFVTTEHKVGSDSHLPTGLTRGPADARPRAPFSGPRATDGAEELLQVASWQG